MNDSALKKQISLKVADPLTSVYKGIDKMSKVYIFGIEIQPLIKNI